jgi:putative zinc finger protein
VTHQEALDMLATERYLLDEMSQDERHRFEEHFFACDECADDMRTAATMLQGAKAGFAGTPRKAALRHPSWYRSLAIPWAAAATLALVAGYQAFWVLPSLRRGAPVALAPITLHPASRGAETVVPVGAGGDPVTLAVDGIDSTGKVTWTLSHADGRLVTSGDANAPPPGAPLLLLMPSWTLTTTMHYILAFHDTAPSARLLGEYRFSVSRQ